MFIGQDQGDSRAIKKFLLVDLDSGVGVTCGDIPKCLAIDYA